MAVVSSKSTDFWVVGQQAASVVRGIWQRSGRAPRSRIAPRSRFILLTSALFATRFLFAIRNTSCRNDPSPHTSYVVILHPRSTSSRDQMISTVSFVIVCYSIFHHWFNEMGRRYSTCPRRYGQPRCVIQPPCQWIQWNCMGAEITGRFPFIRRTRYARTGFIYFIVLLSVISSFLMLLMLIFRDWLHRILFVQLGTLIKGDSLINNPTKNNPI
jgi:hypothetical protein